MEAKPMMLSFVFLQGLLDPGFRWSRIRHSENGQRVTAQHLVDSVFLCYSIYTIIYIYIFIYILIWKATLLFESPVWRDGISIAVSERSSTVPLNFGRPNRSRPVWKLLQSPMRFQHLLCLPRSPTECHWTCGKIVLLEYVTGMFLNTLCTGGWRGQAKGNSGSSIIDRFQVRINADQSIREYYI